MKFFLTIIAILEFSCANDNFYYQNNKKIYLTPYQNISRSISNINYYQNDKGVVLGVTDKLIVKLKDVSNIKSLTDKYDLILVKKLSKNLYLMKVGNKNSTIDIANKLNEENSVEYAQPDFIKTMFHR
jgi:hypothetical protein